MSVPTGFSARTNRLVDHALEDTVERLRDSGRLDRRGFLRVLSVGALAPLLAACDAQGTPGMRKLLTQVGTQNEKLERWLLRFAGNDHVPPHVRAAGDLFPSYFISDVVPVWNTDMRGPWALEVGGAVRTPMRFDLAQLNKLATRTHRVHHYCVEGWSAAVQFQGVPFQALAKLVQPLPNAGYVDFSSFDSGYHESWDLESTMHPQTLVAIAKDGVPLSPKYGAPARIHSPIKLGYKNTKYLTRITFMTARNGGYWSDLGYEWLGGT